MKTKAEIVQDLLDKRLLSAEDAVVLLTPTEPQYFITQPAPIFQPWPWNQGPIYQTEPFRVTCEQLTTNHCILN